jgi:uncharacterized protein (UPF0332 family)
MNDSFLDRAKENLNAAELLLHNGMFNASANRAYYSAFHITVAFLLNKGIETKIDHKNILSFFINEYINRKKVFPSQFKRYLYDMQDIRNNADYKNGASKNKSIYQLKLAKEFFEIIYKEIKLI